MSQPYVAKLESDRIRNLGVKTLVKYALALGGKLTLKIDTRNFSAVHQLVEEMKADQRDARVSAARLANLKEKRIPYAEVRKRAGL